MSRAATPPDSICLLRLSAIGDCCHVLPLVRTLQKTWPATRLTWIIGRTEHRLMEGLDGVEFITFDKAAGLRGVFDVRGKLHGRSFPLLLNLHASMRANLVSLAVSARRRIGYDRARARDWQWLFTNERIPAVPGEHVCDAMLGFARYLGIDDPVIDWNLPIGQPDRDWADTVAEAAGPVCVLSPCSSQRARNFRNWSIDNYAAVVAHLEHQHGARVLLTGANSPTEREYAAELTKRGSNVTNLMGQTSLKQLAALIERADVVLCPDSGPVHIATAVGTPVVGLYATSNPARTGPYRDPLQLTVNRYPDAVEKTFGKSADALRWGQRVRDPAAMDLITVAEVTRSLDRALTGSAAPLT